MHDHPRRIETVRPSEIDNTTLEALKIQRSIPWLPGLDILRASAVFLVLIGHGKILLSPESRTIFEAVFPMPAAWGVELFFSLSGFLIGRQWLASLKCINIHNSIGSASHFILRRWLRTMPTFWLCFAIFWSLGLVAYSNPLPHWLAANLFLIPELTHTTAAIPVSWTLTIEELSYLVFGLSIYVYGLFIRSPTHLRLMSLAMPIALIAIGTQARAMAIHSGQWDLIWNGPLQRIDALAYGCVLACIFNLFENSQCHGQTQSFRSRLYIPGFLLLFALIFGIQGWCEHNLSRMVPLAPDTAYQFGLTFIPLLGLTSALATALCAAATQLPAAWPLQLISPINYLAKISYSVYLVHIPIRSLLEVHKNALGDSAMITFVFLSILAGTITYVALEKPFLQLRRKLT